MNRLWVIFDVVCFLLALYMTVILIGRYQGNKSATSIAYKKYTDTDEDQYPTFSICFYGDGLYQYNGSATYEAYGINPANYEKMLKGQPTFGYKYDIASKLYHKTSLSVTENTHLTFDELVLKSNDLSDIIYSATFEAEKTNLSVRYTNGNGDKPPFYVSFQTPDMRCLTRDWRKNTNLIRVRDSVSLARYGSDGVPLEWYSNANIKLFVHYPGQLITVLDSFSFRSAWNDIQNEAWQIKVSQSTVWRRRSVEREPCLKDIDDYDQHFQQVVSEKIGCVPPFWINRVNFTSIGKECTSLEELKKVNDYLIDYKNWFDDIQTPCIDMFNSVVWNKLGEGSNMEINYAEKYYEEISQAEDFGVQDFISNLGGFIGIFLGYSMMQIPELLSKFGSTFIFTDKEYIYTVTYGFIQFYKINLFH